MGKRSKKENLQQKEYHLQALFPMMEARPLYLESPAGLNLKLPATIFRIIVKEQFGTEAAARAHQKDHLQRFKTIIERA